MQESEQTPEETEQTPQEPSETQAGENPWDDPKVEIQRQSIMDRK